MKNTTVWVVAVLIVIVGLYFWMNGGPSSTEETDSTPTPSASATPVNQAPTTKNSTPAPTSAGDYTTLVKEYEGRRIQFGERCQPSPSSATYKTGDRIMLDNRSTTTRVVSVGGSSYTLPGYGFQIVTLTGTSLPQEIKIGCDSIEEVGKILLQAQISQ